MKSRTALLAGSASAMALMAGAGAYAQDDETETDEITDQIVVRGIRSSLQQSLETKRNADSIIEAINAEDIGKFPDKNVAESLQRLTGVSINREFGEGERVSIRGTDTNLTRTLLNGHAVATADWFILDQLNASRSFNYLMLPSEIVSSLEVYKSPQADIDEGGVGGTVIVRTLRPLDGDEFSIAGSVGASYQDLADEIKPQGSLLINWHNRDDTFGINVAGIYQNREIRRDGFEVLGYSSVQPDATLNSGLPAEGALVPDLIGSALFTQQRERLGFNGAAQWRPNDRLDVVASGLYSKFYADNRNLNFLASPSRKTNVAGNFFTASDVRDGTVFAGTFDANAPGFSIIHDSFYREAVTKTQAYDLDITYRAKDNLTFHVNGGYTTASGNTRRQLGWEALSSAPGFSYDISGGVPRVAFDASVNPGDPNDPLYVNEVGWAGGASVFNDDSEFYVFADAEREFEDAGVFRSLKAGVKYTNHDRETLQLTRQLRSLFSWSGPEATGCDGNGGVQTFATAADLAAASGFHRCGLADVGGGLTPSNFLEDIAVAGSLTSYLTLDPGLAELVLDAIPIQPYGGPAVGPFAPPLVQYTEPNASFDVSENTIGGFIMADLEGDRWRGNIGVRVVHTEVTAGGFQTGLTLGDPGTQADNFLIPPEYVGGFVARTEDNASYTDILPSLNLVYDVTDDFLVRVAAARTMTRPDYNNLADFVFLNVTSFTGSGGGGANLDPFRANQFDLSLEWYFAEDAALNVGFFYKDLNSIVFTDTAVERHRVTPSIDDNGTPMDTSDDFAVVNDDCVLVGGTFPNETYECNFDVSRPRNVGGATIRGIEVAYQQPLWSGFGFVGNYTFTDTEQQDGLPMPGASKHLFNLTGYYENDWLSARLSYTHRTDFFIAIDRANPLSQNDTKSLDASITYNINDNFAISADALNLTDATINQYSVLPERVRAIYDNGRTVFVTLRGKI